MTSSRDSLDSLGDRYGIKITIPDAPPKEELEMIDNFINILRIMGEVAGEVEETEQSLKPLFEAKAKLEAKLKGDIDE